MFAQIDHVGVAVDDLDAAIALHEGAYGMALAHREVVEEQGVEAVLLDVGENHVELLRPLGPETTVGRFVEKRGGGLHHVAYRVADIDAACAALRDKGLRLLYDVPRRGTAGSRINFVHPRDAGGVLVELVEPAAH